MPEETDRSVPPHTENLAVFHNNEDFCGLSFVEDHIGGMLNIIDDYFMILMSVIVLVFFSFQ